MKGFQIQTNQDISILKMELMLLSFAQMYLLIGAVSQVRDVANGTLALFCFYFLGNKTNV